MSGVREETKRGGGGEGGKEGRREGVWENIHRSQLVLTTYMYYMMKVSYCYICTLCLLPCVPIITSHSLNRACYRCSWLERLPQNDIC